MPSKSKKAAICGPDGPVLISSSSVSSVVNGLPFKMVQARLRIALDDGHCGGAVAGTSSLPTAYGYNESRRFGLSIQAFVS